ncbi:hypothetical protein GUJ93_ZPchr0014g46957 [Zizania palustris]|uniref:Thioesterase domain-containing protein n=1 Tax=Zizania palustris TaxID=103762 RepID=A0A8J5SY93_ZIZPA|nr:hypothetical protein GUJ93_ZPchr0014g46957 [Zizania palustris]
MHTSPSDQFYIISLLLDHTMQQQQMSSLLTGRAAMISRPAACSGHRVVVPHGSGLPAKLGRVRAYAYRPTTRRAIKGSPVVAVVAAPKSSLLQDDVSVAAPPDPCLQLLQDAPYDKKATSQPHANSLSEERFFEVEMSVHDDDLDEYRVVNNAIYASYIHICRDVFLENVGIGVGYWTSTGNALALSDLNLKFFTPLKVNSTP